MPFRRLPALLLAVCIGAACARALPSATDDFASAMAAAMTRMDQGMMAPASGDPDRDFAAMMIPHHQGAIDMAAIVLRFGRDERLRRLAQGIIVEQGQEIAVMRQVLDSLPPPPPHTDSHPAHSSMKDR